MGYTQEELAELCHASSLNTNAILENNKQIIDNNLINNEAY